MNKSTGKKISRRRSLALIGAGAASLAAARLPNHWGMAEIPAFTGDNSVTIRTHEHFGDLKEQLYFPDNWELDVVHMKGHGRPGLTSDQIRDKLDHPIDTPPLREIAAGKKTVVITFDDLSRPTPVKEIMPLLVEDLRAAGIQDKNILFLTSYGSHRGMTHAEARAKLGDFIVNNFAWINHNPWENLMEIGTTSRGNRIKINHNFVQADLRITVSGLKGHDNAGYGGGAKAVLPGVAWIESIHYFHREIGGNSGMANVFNNDIRQDMEETARMADVNFSVQVIYNEHREPVDIYAGDVVTAHHAACRTANGILRTPTVKDSDIVIANGYPQNKQATKALRWIRSCLSDGGSGVLIAQHPDAISTIHYLVERWRFSGKSYWEMQESDRKPVSQASQLIVYSKYLQQKDVNEISAKNVILARSWAEVVILLQKQHQTDARVAVYPYATIQHKDIDLT